ncbi:MAG: hypothetical protein J7K40_02150 [candidate division Zixibacteria bacterium]|nr:hypothetical protein [candidate division Zixibacteria bacterium]
MLSCNSFKHMKLTAIAGAVFAAICIFSSYAAASEPPIIDRDNIFSLPGDCIYQDTSANLELSILMATP